MGGDELSDRQASRRRRGSRASVFIACWILAVLCLTTTVATQRPVSIPSFRVEDPGTRERSSVEPMLSGTVLPSVETEPSHHPGDTADDMAIWIHPTDPSLSLVIGDDKEGGLMVWDLEGKERQYVEGTDYNNVDLRYNFPLEGTFGTGESHANVSLVGVSDQGGQQFDFFKVNPYARRLEPVGGLDVSITPYGGCMYFSALTGTYFFIAPDFSGVTEQWEVRDGGNGRVVGSLARTFDVGSVAEGCVADDLLGHLYMAEEATGIWKYGAEPDAGDARTQVDSTKGVNLVSDVEGLSIYYAGLELGYLFASSQGDSQVAVYTREGGNDFVGKFDVGADGTIDAVTSSDGLDITNFPLAGPFGAGLFAIHDAANSDANASNVKLVGYGAIASALGLVIDTLWDPRLVGSELPLPPPFDFAVSVDPPAASVEPGESFDAAVTATLVSGSPQDVLFSCEDLPEGASCTFVPPSCDPTCGATLTLATDLTTPEETYPIGVRATNGAVSRTAIFLLTVAKPPSPPFDFSVAVEPAAGSVEPAGSLNLSVTATWVSGSSHDVRWSCEDLPAGTSCAFTPPSCTPTCGADLWLSTDPSTPDGIYTLRVEGSDGTITRAMDFALTVAAPPPPPPPLVPTSLSLDPEAPDPSRPREEVTFSVLLVRNDTRTPLAGRSVVVEGSDDGGRTWWPAGAWAFVTGEDGRATGTIVFLQAGEDQRLRARFDGEAAFDKSVSHEEPHATREEIPPPQPNPPTARFTFDPPEPRVGEPVAFDASSSTSDPGTTLQVQWDWDGDGSWDTLWSSNLHETHVFADAGGYSAVLQVLDSNGLLDTDEREVQVRPPPVPPDTSLPTISITSPANGSTVTGPNVTFTGTAQDDRGIAAIELSLDGLTWTSASGTSAWTATLALANGANIVYLRATDTSENEWIVSILVTVHVPGEPPTTPPPTPSASGPDPLFRLLPVVGGPLVGAALLGLSALMVRRVRRRLPAPVRSDRRRAPRSGLVADAALLRDNEVTVPTTPSESRNVPDSQGAPQDRARGEEDRREDARRVAREEPIQGEFHWHTERPHGTRGTGSGPRRMRFRAGQGRLP